MTQNKLHYDTERAYFTIAHKICNTMCNPKNLLYTFRYTEEGKLLLPGIKYINIIVYHAHESVAF